MTAREYNAALYVEVITGAYGLIAVMVAVAAGAAICAKVMA
jgi:hypothetical protein